jgi:hypothetical protein
MWVFFYISPTQHPTIPHKKTLAEVRVSTSTSRGFSSNVGLPTVPLAQIFELFWYYNVFYVFLKLGGLVVNFTPEGYFGV